MCFIHIGSLNHIVVLIQLYLSPIVSRQIFIWKIEIRSIVVKPFKRMALGRMLKDIVHIF